MINTFYSPISIQYSLIIAVHALPVGVSLYTHDKNYALAFFSSIIIFLTIYQFKYITIEISENIFKFRMHIFDITLKSYKTTFDKVEIDKDNVRLYNGDEVKIYFDGEPAVEENERNDISFYGTDKKSIDIGTKTNKQDIFLWLNEELKDYPRIHF